MNFIGIMQGRLEAKQSRQKQATMLNCAQDHQGARTVNHGN